ncbi:MAG: flagellar hook-associated protein FlgL [Pseudomonadota bacterium]|jgi:flagellar hook-associated protein 3 FlgL
MDARISSALFFQQGLSGIQTAQTGMARAMQEISSGKRELSPALDPVVSTTVTKLEQSVSRLTQYQRNADAANARLGQTENALQGMTEVISRARELAIEFNKSTHDAVSRGVLRNEFGQLRDQMRALLNTQDERGEYIFAGSKVTTQPYPPGNPQTYAGDGLALNMQVAEGRTLQVGQVFSDPVNPDEIKTFLNTLDALATGTEPVPNEADLTPMLAALDKAVTLRAQVGNAMNAVSLARADNEGELYGYTTTLSALRDTDYASAITQLNQQTLLLQATQSTLAKVQGLSLFNVI